MDELSEARELCPGAVPVKLDRGRAGTWLGLGAGGAFDVVTSGLSPAVGVTAVVPVEAAVLVAASNASAPGFVPAWGVDEVAAGGLSFGSKQPKSDWFYQPH